MTKLDSNALDVAQKTLIDRCNASEANCEHISGREALSIQIEAYRQAECRPFSEAPKDGTYVEAWDSCDREWRLVKYIMEVWLSSRGLHGDGKWFTHYRLPFNPTLGDG